MRSVQASFLFVCAVLVLSFGAAVDADEVLTLALDEPEATSNTKSVETPTAPAKVPKQAGKSEARVGRVGIVTLPKAGIYRRRSGTSARYYTAQSKTPLAIIKEEGDWYGVLMSNGATGWINRSAVKMTDYELVADKSQPDRSSNASRAGSLDRTGTLGTSLVQTAMGYSGSPYLYGGADPATGIDCSAFVRLVFSRCGIRLPRTAREQAQVGSVVPFDRLVPGDRLYFCCKNSYVDHCGIYAGNGYFIHSSASRGGVGFDSLASDFYWRTLIVARR